MAKVKFAPKSLLGKLSLVFLVLMPILFAMGGLFPNVNEVIPPGEPPHPRLIVDLLDTGAFIVGSAAFFSGIIGIIIKKDYSVLVFITTLLGLIVFLYFIQISFFPGLIDYT